MIYVIKAWMVGTSPTMTRWVDMRYEAERAPDVAFTDVKDYQKG